MAVRALSGVIVPGISPMRKDKSIDFAEFREHFIWLGMQRVGLMMIGTTGEGNFLNTNEKMRMLEKGPSITDEVRARTKGREHPLLVAGTGTFELDEAKFIAKYAGMYGFDAVIALPPRTTNQAEIMDFYIGLAKHLESIPESVRPRLYAYNIPSLTKVKIDFLTGTHIHPETIGKLVGMKAIVGLKDSGQDPVLLEMWRRENPDVEVIIGEDKLIQFAVTNPKIKAVAAVAGSGNPDPQLIINAFNARGERGRLAQAEVDTLVDGLLLGRQMPFCIPVKGAMRDRHMIRHAETRAQ